MIKNKFADKKQPLNVFHGTNAIIDFLNPQNNPYPPLVELPKALNPYFNNNIKIYAKLMNYIPLRNIKSLPAYNMLIHAKEKNKLKNTKEIIESSSGNTILSMAPIARNLGIKSINALIPDYVTKGKLKLLQLFGVNIIIYKDPADRNKNNPKNRVNTAKRIGSKMNWFNPSQYDNPNNPEIHKQITGPQIWQQTNGAIDIFCAGMGTTGTIVGTTAYLKSKNKHLLSIGVNQKDAVVPGVRGKEQLKELSFDWKSALDSIEEVIKYDAYKMSLSLIRHGIIAGPSSGLSYRGLLQYFSKSPLTKQKNKKEIIAVFMCFDDPFAYMDEYFQVLGESHFPKIEQSKGVSFL